MTEGWAACGDPEAVFRLTPSACALLLAARARETHDRVLADPSSTTAQRLRARIALGEIKL